MNQKPFFYKNLILQFRARCKSRKAGFQYINGRVKKKKKEYEDLLQRMENAIFGLHRYFDVQPEEKDAEISDLLKYFQRNNKDLKQDIPIFITVTKKLELGIPVRDQREKRESSAKNLLYEYEYSAIDEQIRLLSSLKIRKNDPELSRTEWRPDFFERVRKTRLLLVSRISDPHTSMIELTAHESRLRGLMGSLKTSISTIETGHGAAEQLRRALWDLSTEERIRNARAEMRSLIKKCEDEKLQDNIELARNMGVNREVILPVVRLRLILEEENINQKIETATQLEALTNVLKLAIKKLSDAIKKKMQEKSDQSAVEKLEKEFLS